MCVSRDVNHNIAAFPLIELSTLACRSIHPATFHFVPSLLTVKQSSPTDDQSRFLKEELFHLFVSKTTIIKLFRRGEDYVLSTNRLLVSGVVIHMTKLNFVVKLFVIFILHWRDEWKAEATRSQLTGSRNLTNAQRSETAWDSGNAICSFFVLFFPRPLEFWKYEKSKSTCIAKFPRILSSGKICIFPRGKKSPSWCTCRGKNRFWCEFCGL